MIVMKKMIWFHPYFIVQLETYYYLHSTQSLSRINMIFCKWGLF